MDDSDRLSALRAELIKRMGRDRYELWVGPQATLTLVSGELHVICSSTFELQCIRRHAHGHLTESCRAVLGEGVRIDYVVRADSTTPLQKTADKLTQKNLLIEDCEPELSRDPPNLRKERPNISEQTSATKRFSNSMLTRSTFESFVGGACNELALRTAKTVADRIGYYGPLLLYGPAGVGKTHLSYAIVHHLRKSSNYRVLRLTSEQFTTEFLDSLRQHTTPSFRQKYRSVDVLLVDDIQFLLTKKATLDELLVTIDSLHERGKQVVLTCDLNPQELLKFNGDLSTRISGGLAVPMELPDFATRQALVRKFIAEMHPRIGMAIDDEVVVTIATHVGGSPRQLRGAINRLIVGSDALGKPLSADLARTILAEYVQQITPAVRLPDIQRAVCEVFGIEATRLKSPSKSRSVAEPRMLAMWLACQFTRSALGEISEFFGRRSHSTVISAQKKIERMVSQGEMVSVANQDCKVEEAIRRIEQLMRTA